MVLNLVSIVLLSISNPVRATTYRTSFLKNVVMGLGDCHDPGNPTQAPLSNALSFEIAVDTEREDLGIAVMRIVRDRSDFVRALNIDVNLAAACRDHEQGPQILQQMENDLGSDSVCFILSESRLYPVEEVRSPRPHCPPSHVTPFIEALRSYPEVVVKQQRGAAYFILVCLKGVSPTEKLDIKTHVEAAIARFEKNSLFPVEEFSSLLGKYKDVSIRFDSFGCDPILELSTPVFFNLKALGAYSKLFMNVLHSMQDSHAKASFETAIPIIFETEPTDALISKMTLGNVFAYGAH